MHYQLEKMFRHASGNLKVKSAHGYLWFFGGRNTGNGTAFNAKLVCCEAQSMEFSPDGNWLVIVTTARLLRVIRISWTEGSEGAQVIWEREVHVPTLGCPTITFGEEGFTIAHNPDPFFFDPLPKHPAACADWEAAL